MRHTYKTSNAFTVVEIVVGLTISTLILLGVLSLVIALINSGTRSIEVSKQSNEVQTGIGLIRDDLKLTNNFLVTSSITDTPPSGTAWNFRGSGATNRVLILKTLATSGYKTDTNRQPVYLQTGDCPIGNAPAYNNIVYFVRNATLYRRIIVTPPAANLYCAGQNNAQIRTCISPGATSEPANCREKDVIIANDVTNFNVIYYTNPSDATPSGTVFDTGTVQAQLDNLSTVQVTITTQKIIDGQDNEYSAKIRATRSISL